MSVAFVRRLNAREARSRCPFTARSKRCPTSRHETGERVTPSAPNAVKLEMFVFDALPLADKSVILQTDRVEEFAPIKNAQGDDSPKSSRRLQSARAARWLRLRGVELPLDGEEVDAVIELRPLTAIEPDDLKNA